MTRRVAGQAQTVPRAIRPPSLSVMLKGFTRPDTLFTVSE
jgi:hypothetical protein